MKTLILFLLASVITGQIDRDKIETHFGTFSWHRDSIDARATKIITSRLDEWAYKFVNYFDEYAKECYADSVGMGESYSFVPDESLAVYDTTYYFGVPFIGVYTEITKYYRGGIAKFDGYLYYEHKTPTPMGFIEFLRSKINN